MDRPVASTILGGWATPGLAWFAAACVGAALCFADGFAALAAAWQAPEYSHGPLIPVLSALLFLRQMRDSGTASAPSCRWPGVALAASALTLGILSNLSGIADLAAYGLILWLGAMVLIGFGWLSGRHYWPPVLHLVYMLPLPGVLYFKLSTGLQLLSSEMGVAILRGLDVPVFLAGNIIDLGVYRLHVAEACSGLRYLFPILSFSYIFAVLYRGPLWQKTVLLLAAAPITVGMNALRIAVAGYIVNTHGVDWVAGATHFFEGWVIFLACIVVLMGLAWTMLRASGDSRRLADALDLDTAGLAGQAARLRGLTASPAMIGVATMAVVGALAVPHLPDRDGVLVDRAPFAVFPQKIGSWEQAGLPTQLTPRVASALGADDYLGVAFHRGGSGPGVQLFLAWYADQSAGGVHSPEICLPGAGWEIAWLERTAFPDDTGDGTGRLNRAIVQRGDDRQLVYYWFDQKGRRIAWDFAAKFWLMTNGIRTGRTDGALVRLSTPILPDESDTDATRRLDSALRGLLPALPRFLPAG